MQNATAVVHAGPAIHAGFVQYTAEMQPGGLLGDTDLQRFAYVLDGTINVDENSLGPGGYVYLPEGEGRPLRAASAARVAVIEKEFNSYGSKPEFFVGKEDGVSPHPLGCDETLQVRSLIPDDPRFDFAVNTMVYQPGAALSMVEVHVMEHGLLMLEGGGIYRLSDCWYPVSAGDFIYMAPFCPQWFGAIGRSPAKYLIYKDWNRHPASR
jgi:(S)-ureidoglycine aminohydrolase